MQLEWIDLSTSQRKTHGRGLPCGYNQGLQEIKAKSKGGGVEGAGGRMGGLDNLLLLNSKVCRRKSKKHMFF